MGRDPFTALGGRLTNGDPKSALPAIGGFVGGLAGGGAGPVSIGGAAVGGGAGEALRQAIGGENIDPERIGLSAGAQGAAQAAGGILAKGAKAAARPIMRAALGVGKSISGKVKLGARLIPDPVETNIALGIEANEKGALKANALRRASGREYADLVGRDTRQLSTREVTKYAREMLLDEALPTAEKKKVFNELVSFYREKGGRMTPKLVQRVKRYYGGIYKGWDKGSDPLTDPTRGSMAKEIARGAREALGPEIGTKAGEYSALKGAQKATENAVRRPDPRWEVVAPGTYPILRGLIGNKSINSKIAIRLADPATQAALRQTPRAVVELVQQLLHQDEPDATSGQ